MNTKKINHIGIAVNSLDASIPFYRDQLGMEFEGSEVVEDQKVKVAFLVVGESRIELLEPTCAESPVAKFIEKKVKAFTTSLTKSKMLLKRLKR